MIDCVAATGLSGHTNAFAVLHRLPTSRDKDLKVFTLLHQITVLERHLGSKKGQFTPIERALLAALLHRPPPKMLARLRLLVAP